MSIDKEKSLKFEYFLEAIYYNKGLTKLISGGLLGLLLSLDRGWRYLYAILIGIGISGLMFWVFSCKLFNKENFNLFYFLWIICCVIEVTFTLFVVFILHEHNVNEMESIEEIFKETSGFIAGVLVSSVLLEINLKFISSSILIEYKKPL